MARKKKGKGKGYQFKVMEKIAIWFTVILSWLVVMHAGSVAFTQNLFFNFLLTLDGAVPYFSVVWGVAMLLIIIMVLDLVGTETR